MPIYIYQHPETEEPIEVIQGMNEDHVYFDESGVEWQRVFTTPSMAMDLESDPYSEKQYLERTAGGGKMKDLWGRAQEMSDKRSEKNGGVDPMKKKYFKEYSKKRGGAKHLDDH